MKFDSLTKQGPPQLHVVELEAAKARDAILALSGLGVQVRLVRGKKAQTVPTFFNEISAALQFPLYFGENWDALDECLADLSWLDAKEGLVLVFANASDLLKSAGAKDTEILARILRDTATQWHTNRKTPFHIVLQVEPGDAESLKSRWGDLKEIR